MISQSAINKLAEMKVSGMKDAFGRREVFERHLALSAEAADLPFEAPSYLDERVRVLRWTAQDGTPCFTLYLKSSCAEDVWADRRQLIYLHGGGLVMQVGPPHWEFCLSLVERLGCVVTVPIYPLLPGATWQDAHASVVATYLGLLEKSGAASRDVVIAGDSAGGLLAITLMQLCKLHDLPEPGAVITLSPMTDVAHEIPDGEKMALVDDDPLIGLEGLGRVPDLWVPDAGDRGQFPPCVLQGPMSDLPPQWLFAGSRECLLPEMVEYARRVEEAGSPIVFDVREGLWHTYPLQPDVEEGAAAFEQILDVLRSEWSMSAA